MMVVSIEPHFTSWRLRARELLSRGTRPEDVDWVDGTQTLGLLHEETDAYQSSLSLEVKVPAAFLKLAEQVCAHRDERRWAILYRLLYRLTLGGERHLLTMPTDPDMRQCEMWARAVAREVHKMHAFVRFRGVGIHEATGREEFVAWFEPMYPVLRLAAPFFEKRFAGMNWSILTPEACVSWDGEKLTFLPGMSRQDAPAADAHDDLWRTYYRSIFNPARLKVQTMQSSMPQKYWKNLPEAQIIPELISSSQSRVNTMLETEERPVKPMPNNAYLQSLHRRIRKQE